MLVALAGPDGAGKSTLSRAVRDHLSTKGIDAVRIDRFDILDSRLSPASGFIDTDILTLRESYMAMPTASARLLFILWSIAITTGSQLADPRSRRVVIYDSYWMKHTAAEIIFGADEELALAATRLLPEPDLVLHVKLPPETLLARKPDDRVPYECGKDEECRPESFLVHQRRIQAYLNAWSERFGWTDIDGAQPLEALVEQVSSRIEERLAESGPGRGDSR